VLVTHDVLGLFQEFKPKFVRRYAELHLLMVKACQEYGDDVRTGNFPAVEHTFSIDKKILQQLVEELDKITTQN